MRVYAESTTLEKAQKLASMLINDVENMMN